MHIAICDDNVADRKHLERLLSRESDKRMGTPNILYVDSYGNEENFFKNPEKYDLFFIDMVHSPDLTLHIVKRLQKMGIDAPIVLYSSKIDYSTISELSAGIVHMKKPYIPDPLPELLKLGDQYVTGHVETIVLHTNQTPRIVPAHDIFYFFETKDGKKNLCMKDGTTLQIMENIGEVGHILEPYQEYARISKTAVVNMRLVTLVTPFSIMMQDYKEFFHSPFRYRELRDWKLSMDELGEIK